MCHEHQAPPQSPQGSPRPSLPDRHPLSWAQWLWPHRTQFLPVMSNMTTVSSTTCKLPAGDKEQRRSAGPPRLPDTLGLPVLFRRTPACGDPRPGPAGGGQGPHPGAELTDPLHAAGHTCPHLDAPHCEPKTAWQLPHRKGLVGVLDGLRLLHTVRWSFRGTHFPASPTSPDLPRPAPPPKLGRKWRDLAPG